MIILWQLDWYVSNIARERLWDLNLLKSLFRLLISGVNNAVSTAFGITDTFSFCTLARNTVFSFPVWDTHMQWSQSTSEIWRNLFVRIADASAKPKREWSVKIVCKHSVSHFMLSKPHCQYNQGFTFNPINLPISIPSWAKAENAEWPCTICISSLMKIYLMSGREHIIVGRTHWL